MGKNIRTKRDTRLREADELWYRVADLARRLRISEHGVRTAIASGHLQVVRLGGLRRGRGHCIRISPSAVAAWLGHDE
jgi:hypothetical protein